MKKQRSWRVFDEGRGIGVRMVDGWVAVRFSKVINDDWQFEFYHKLATAEGPGDVRGAFKWLADRMGEQPAVKLIRDEGAA